MDAEEEQEEELELEEEPAEAGPVPVPTMDEEVQGVLMGLSSRSEEALVSAVLRMRRLVAEEGGGARMLQRYVLDSPKCVELSNAWAAGPKARAAVPLMLLLAEMFRHPMGLPQKRDQEDKKQLAVQLRLDKLALSIVQNKLGDVYSHLSSGQRSRQNGALRLMAAVVHRGKLVAKQVAARFDFTLEALGKLGKRPQKKQAQEQMHTSDVVRMPTRVAFIEFALPFLVVADANLLRWILQKRVLYAGVLHGLSGDPDHTVIRVLAILKWKVLNSGLVPQGIQVALFGDASLEQLARITAWPDSSSEAVDLAREMLLELCTNPAHGICPSSNSWEGLEKSSSLYGGGAGRLLRLMLRLRATEVDLHRDLLLAIAEARPVIAAAYIDSFPYSLEPRASPNWFSTMELLTRIIAIVSSPDPFTSASDQQHCIRVGEKSPMVQRAVRRIWPQTLSRAVFNRGLFHSDPFVKLICVKLLVEVLQALRRLLTFIEKAGESSPQQFKSDWSNLASYVQDRARVILPECGTLLMLKKPLEVESQDGSATKGKRKHEAEDGASKRQKCETKERSDQGDNKRALAEQTDVSFLMEREINPEESLESTLRAKLMQALSLYQLTMPLAVMDSNFDAFKHIPENLEALTVGEEKALVDLLASTVLLPSVASSLYRNVKVLMKLMLHGKTDTTKQKVYHLIERVLCETGTSENACSEGLIWLHSLPGWNTESTEKVFSFFSDVVLSLGNSTYKYLEQLHSVLNKDPETKGDYEFGPFTVCALDAFMRLTGPKAKSLDISQRSTISVYLSNALHTLLSFQTYPRPLAFVITSMLSVDDRDLSGCEFYGARSIYLHAANILEAETSSCWAGQNKSLGNLLDICMADNTTPASAKAYALSKTLTCIPPSELAENFLRLLEIFKGDCSVLQFLLGAYPHILREVSKVDSRVFSEAVRIAAFEESQGIMDSLTAQLAWLLSRCSIFTLMEAAFSGNGVLFNVPYMVELLASATGRLSGNDMLVAAKLIINRIKRSQEVKACFILLSRLFCSCHSAETMKQLLEVVLEAIGTWFLTSNWRTEEISLLGNSDTDDAGEQATSHLLEKMEPLDRHTLEFLSMLLRMEDSTKPELASIVQDSLRPLLHKALEVFQAEFKRGFSDQREFMPSASLVSVFMLGSCDNQGMLVSMLKTTGKEIRNLSTELQSYQRVWFYLASKALKELKKHPTKLVRNGMVDFYTSILQLTTMTGAALQMSPHCLLTAAELLIEASVPLSDVTPLEALTYCFQNPDTTTQKLALLLVHQDAFRDEFGRLVVTTPLSREQLKLFLPVVRLYFESEGPRCNAAEVAKICSKLCLKKLTKWASEVDLPCSENSDEDFLVFSDLLAVLKVCISVGSVSTKEKNRLLRSLLPEGVQLLDPRLKQAEDVHGLDAILDMAAGKASVLYMVLVHMEGEEAAALPGFVSSCIATISTILKLLSKRESSGAAAAAIVKEQLLPLTCDAIGKLTPYSDALVPIRKLSKTILRFQYGQVRAMAALQQLFLKLFQYCSTNSIPVRSLAKEVIQYVISHSQFIPLLLARTHSSSKAVTISSLSSPLSLLQNPADWNPSPPSPVAVEEEQALSLVKLLRVLHALESVGEEQKGVRKQLLPVLMAAYSATLSMLDQEIFLLMNEIDDEDCSGRSGMDYLWGTAALGKWKEDNDELMQDSREEIRKRRFKEDLALDPRKCGMTVLHFPSTRELWCESSSKGLGEPLPNDTFQDSGAHTYDPAYMIPFAVHGLSVGCLEPEDVVRSGVLALVFSAMASASESMRKGAYELLSRFTGMLEASSSFKGKLQMSTLLSFLRNAITDSWQRIPSVIAVFAAEASCLLMHPESLYYIPVNRFLLRSPSIDLESVPLFQQMFTSGSAHARSERAWMLKLLLAGLVSSADADIYRRHFVPEILMSFCTSSMADSMDLKWVLQILKRAAAIPSFSKSLIGNNGALLWLTSIALTNEDHREDALEMIRSLGWSRKKSHFTIGMDTLSLAVIPMQCKV